MTDSEVEAGDPQGSPPGDVLTEMPPLRPNEGTAAPRRSPVPWRFALLVFVLAAGVRLAFAGFPDVDLEQSVLDNDSPSYFEQASRLAEDGDFMSAEWLGPGPDNGKVVPTAIRPPLWVVVQAVPYAIADPDPTTGRLLNIVLDSAACAVLVLVGTRLAGKWVGLLGGLFAAFYPQFIFGTRQLMSEPLLMLLIALLLLAADRFLEQPNPRRGAMLGLTIGLVSLTRGNGWTLAVLFGLWFLWRGRAHVKPAVQQLLPVAAVAALVVLPYVAYASARMGQLVPVSNQMGTLLAGDFTDTVADTGHPYWGWWDIGPTILVLQEVENETEWDKESREVGTEWIADNPGKTMKILALRTVRFFDLYWDIDGRRATELTGERRSLTIGSVVAWWVLAPLAVYGAITLRRRGALDRWMPAIVVFVTFMISGVLFGGANRYRAPGDPAVLLLAASAVASWLAIRVPYFRDREAMGAEVSNLEGHTPVRSAQP